MSLKRNLRPGVAVMLSSPSAVKHVEGMVDSCERHIDFNIIVTTNNEQQ